MTLGFIWTTACYWFPLSLEIRPLLLLLLPLLLPICFLFTRSASADIMFILLLHLITTFRDVFFFVFPFFHIRVSSLRCLVSFFAYGIGVFCTFCIYGVGRYGSTYNLLKRYCEKVLCVVCFFERRATNMDESNETQNKARYYHIASYIREPEYSIFYFAILTHFIDHIPFESFLQFLQNI